MSFQEKLSIDIESSADVSGITTTQKKIQALQAQMESVRTIFSQGLGDFKDSNRKLDNLIGQAEAFDEVLASAGLEEGVGDTKFRDPEKGPGAAGNITDQEGFSRLQRELDRLNISGKDLIDNPDMVLDRVDAGDRMRRQVRARLGAMETDGIPLGGGLQARTRPQGDKGLQGRGLGKGRLIGRGGGGLTGLSLNFARLNELMGIGRVKMRKVSKAGGQAASSFSSFRGKVKGATSAVQQQIPSLQRLQMSLLGVQFSLLSLAFIFGGLMMSALSAVGIFQILGNTLKMFFLPTALSLLPVVMDIRDALLGIDKDTRKSIGRLFAIIAAVGALGSIIAFATSGVLGFLSGIKMIGSALYTAAKFFGFLLRYPGKVLKVLMSLGKVLVMVGSFIYGMVAGFMAALKIFDIFGSVIGFIINALLILAGVAALVAWGVTLPFWAVAAIIGAIVGIILGIIWHFRKGIISFLGGLIGWMAKWGGKLLNLLLWPFKKAFEMIVGNSIIPDLVNDVVNWLFKIPGKIAGLGSQIVNSIAKGIKGTGSKIWNAFKKVLPDFVVDAIGGMGNAVGNAVGAVGDFAGGAVNAAGNFASGIANTAGNLNPLSGNDNGGSTNVQQNNINAQVEVNDKEETPQETGRQFGQGLSQSMNSRQNNWAGGT